MSTSILPVLREVRAELESLGISSPRIERALAKESNRMDEGYHMFMFVKDNGEMPVVAVKWAGQHLTTVYAYQQLLNAGILEIGDVIDDVLFVNLDDFTPEEAIQFMQDLYLEKEQSQ